MHIFLLQIISFTCSCLCRWMPLFSSLCGCRSGGTLTQTVVSFWVVQRVAVYVFSLTLSLSFCPWGFTSHRQDVCWTAVSEFLLWSSAACPRFALLLLSPPAAPVPACLQTAALKSNSLVFCNPDPPELRQYFLERQTALAQGRRKMNVWSLSYCASQLLNVKVIPFQNRVEEIHRPSLTLSVCLSLPTSLLALSHTCYSFLSQFSRIIYLLWIPFFSVILLFISADFSISASFVASAFTRHHYNIWEVKYNLARDYIDRYVDRFSFR